MGVFKKRNLLMGAHFSGIRRVHLQKIPFFFRYERPALFERWIGTNPAVRPPREGSAQFLASGSV